MNWKDLCLLRGSSSALHVKDNFVTSILCGANLHNDFIEDDSIFYLVPKRSFYKKSIVSLTNNSNYEHPIQVFQKANVNQWIDKGAFKISNITEESNEIKVKLVIVTKKKESV